MPEDWTLRLQSLGWPTEALALIAKAGWIRRPAAAVLIAQGDSDDRLFIILEGRVSVKKVLDSGEEKFVGELGPGSYFGELSLLDPAPRSASVEAVERCDLLVVSGSDALRAIRSDGRLGLWFLSNFARKVRSADERLDSRRPVGERLQHALAMLSHGPSSSELVRVSRAELAARCDADVKTISRELTKLHERGLISREGRRIRVLPSQGSALV